MSAERLYSVKQVSELWGVSPRLVWSLVRRGDLQTTRVGARLVKVPEGSLTDYLSGRSSIPTNTTP